MFQMIDKIDKKVLESLKEDGRATVRELSKKLNIPVTTAHNRLRKLKKDGVIKRFTIEPDYEKLGKGILAMVFIVVNHERLEHDLVGLKKKLYGMEEIERIYVMAGDIDLILTVRVASIQELDSLLTTKLRKINGILKTTTQIVIEAN